MRQTVRAVMLRHDKVLPLALFQPFLPREGMPVRENKEGGNRITARATHLDTLLWLSDESVVIHPDHDLTPQQGSAHACTSEALSRDGVHRRGSLFVAS